MKLKYVFGALIALFAFLLLQKNSSSLMGYFFLIIAIIVLLKDVFKGNPTIVDTFYISDDSKDDDISNSFFDSGDFSDGGGGE